MIDRTKPFCCNIIDGAECPNEPTFNIYFAPWTSDDTTQCCRACLGLMIEDDKEFIVRFISWDAPPPEGTLYEICWRDENEQVHREGSMTREEAVELCDRENAGNNFYRWASPISGVLR